MIQTKMGCKLPLPAPRDQQAGPWASAVAGLLPVHALHAVRAWDACPGPCELGHCSAVGRSPRTSPARALACVPPGPPTRPLVHPTPPLHTRIAHAETCLAALPAHHATHQVHGNRANRASIHLHGKRNESKQKRDSETLNQNCFLKTSWIQAKFRPQMHNQTT